MAYASTTKSVYVPIRIPVEMMDSIEAIVAKSVTHRREEPWTVSSFIKAAIVEKLQHMERSRRKRRKAKIIPDCQYVSGSIGDFHGAD